jgi:hypothetical protein
MTHDLHRGQPCNRPFDATKLLARPASQPDERNGDQQGMLLEQ